VTTAVLVDSAAALPADLVHRYGIEVVPMNLIVDGVSRPDIGVSTGELLACLETSEITTSGPSPGDWAAAIERAEQRADEVVVLTLSAEMSSTYRAAELGAADRTDHVHVVDTRSAAGGEGLIALAAARRAAAGATAAEVIAEASAVIDRIHLMATVDDLAHLVRSGRVPGIAGGAARALRVNPLFEFRSGAARPLHPAIGQRAARHRIVHACLASRPEGASILHAAALEAAAPEEATALLAELEREVPGADTFIGSFGPVMLVHVGPGLVGLAWWWQS
jgi:DegV family protein with EDD domain